MISENGRRKSYQSIISKKYKEAMQNDKTKDLYKDK